MNRLYYGDNLGVMREHLGDASVDLVYLDPPFNSQSTYNLLFKTPDGQAAEAQAEAFQDTWTWSQHAEAAYAEVLASGSHCAGILSALRSFLGESDFMAYLAMMAVRLVELHRVLKPTGSLYLHCDPTASHYLKLLLDGIFGGPQFQNEIIWQRTTPKGHAVKKFPSTHDVLLAFRKGETATWNTIYLPHREEYIKKYYNLVESDTGRRFQATSLLNPNPNRPNLTYEYHGYRKVWRWTRERMEKAEQEGRIYFPPRGGVPREKRYLDEQEGTPVTSIWTDIPPVNSQARERLGYPTQKPLTLMERIIQASSNPGDVVLDPFCGCGTTVHAAEGLQRQWVGIDVTHYAITLIEARLQEQFPEAHFEVVGRPTDIDGARDLARRDKYQFQWWANWLVGVQNYRERKKGADRGIDGTIFFRNGPFGTGRVLVSVKGGENLSVAMMRDFRGTIERERAELGLFVCLNEPPKTLRIEAVTAGFERTGHRPGMPYPKIQIATIEQLLRGISPDLPLPYEVSTHERLPSRRDVTSKDEPQLAFTFSISGGKAKGQKKSGEVVHLDPRVRFGGAVTE